LGFSPDGLAGFHSNPRSDRPGPAAGFHRAATGAGTVDLANQPECAATACAEYDNPAVGRATAGSFYRAGSAGSGVEYAAEHDDDNHH
jgi:hypothetical protein